MTFTAWKYSSSERSNNLEPPDVPVVLVVTPLEYSVVFLREFIPARRYRFLDCLDRGLDSNVSMESRNSSKIPKNPE